MNKMVAKEASDIVRAVSQCITDSCFGTRTQLTFYSKFTSINVLVGGVCVVMLGVDGSVVRFSSSTGVADAVIDLADPTIDGFRLIVDKVSRAYQYVT